VLLRWNFSNIVDRDGTLRGARLGNKGEVVYVQEGRLGYEEYAAKGFMLWGFAPTAARQAAPLGVFPICGVDLPFDARDPRVFQTQNYVVTEGYVLDGIELGWDLPGDHESDDATHTDGWRAEFADRIYRAQECRYETKGHLTARSEHNVQGAPVLRLRHHLLLGLPVEHRHAARRLLAGSRRRGDQGGVRDVGAVGHALHRRPLRGRVRPVRAQERLLRGPLRERQRPDRHLHRQQQRHPAGRPALQGAREDPHAPAPPGAEVWFTAMRDGEQRGRRNLPDPPSWLPPVKAGS
jgi:hypothetical protein